MIVNPRVFNYRLTIGTLLAAIAFLVAYGFSRSNALTSDNDFLKQEKKLLQSELKIIINKYGDLGSETITLKSQIESEKAKTQIAQDSLRLLKVDVAVIPRYRDEIMFLNKINEELKTDSYSEVVEALEQENSENEALVKLQSNVIVALEEDKNALNENLNKARLIYANSFKASVFREKNSGDIVETRKASNADYVEVCFAIGENPIAAKGERELYIQVLGPDNNVVADKGAVVFGDSSLIYSKKVFLNYINESEEICVSIPNDEVFKKGTYYISVFEKERKLGNTQLDLY